MKIDRRCKPQLTPKMDGTRGEIVKATNRLHLSKKEMESLRAKRYRLRHPERVRESKLIAQRRYTLRRNFGMTYEDYQKILQDQNGVCAICLNAPAQKALAVDHNHRTGKIRGLLCDMCNRALGQFRENTTNLFRAICYLTKESQ